MFGIISEKNTSEKWEEKYPRENGARAMYAAVKIKSVNLLKFDRRRIGATSGNFFAARAKASDGLETIFLWFISMGRPKRACRQPGSLDRNPGLANLDLSGLPC